MANSPVPGAKRSLLWPALLGVIVVLGIVAVLLGRGSRDETSDTSDAAQTSEVTVSGAAPLAAYDQAVKAMPIVART